MKKIILILCFITLQKDLWSSESNTYNFGWLDPDKAVHVLQNRKYVKSQHLLFHLGYGMTTSGAFVDANAFQGRASYFFNENWGAEFLYSKNNGEENVAAKSLRSPGPSKASTVPFRRIVDGYYGGFILWSPFYAKINTFNSVVYLDWILGAGYGKLDETNNRQEFETNGINSVFTKESHSGPMWTTGLLFFVSQRFTIRLDLTAVHYKAKEAKTDTTTQIWYSNFDASLSLGVSF